MGKHYCRKGGAPIGTLEIPPYRMPGGIVQSDDRLSWEEPSYGRVRMVFRCCGTALVQFIDDSWEGTTTTSAIALDMLSRVPDGVMVTVPCIGAAWTMDLPCGHINGEGCDCDTIEAEAGPDTPAYLSTYPRHGMIDNPATCPLDLV